MRDRAWVRFCSLCGNSALLRSIALITVMLAVTSAQSRAAAPLWGPLAPGRYRVGFKVTYVYDYSRAWQLKTGEYGEVLGRRPRPVRISYWYPALDNGSAMRFGNYVRYTKAPNADFAAADAFLSARDVGNYLRGDFNGNMAALTRLLNMPVYARAAASPAGGRFPLLMYAAGWNSFSPDNVVLCEYLASHGYVVATVPQLPRDSLHTELFANTQDIVVQMRDLQFARGYMENQRLVDATREGLAGYSLGGVVELWTAMSTPGIAAVAALDPSFAYARFAALTSAGEFYSARALTMPLLVLRSSDAAVADRSDAVLHALPYGDVLTGEVAGATHGEFSDYPAIRMYAGASAGEANSVATAETARIAIARCVLEFLNDTVQTHSAAALPACQDSTIASTLSRGAHLPGIGELVEFGTSNSHAALVERIEQLVRAHPNLVVVDENQYNATGYSLLASGAPGRAVIVMEINAIAHPQSANAFDSLADAYIAAKRPANAAEAYRMVQRVAPSDTSLTSAARADILARANAYLARVCSKTTF